MCCLANRGPLNILPYVPSSLHFFPSLTLSRIAQISVSPGSNSSGSAVGALKEVQRKASPRKNIHHRRRMEVESDGSTEETDSSENWSREHIKDVPPLLSLEKKITWLWFSLDIRVRQCELFSIFTYCWVFPPFSRKILKDQVMWMQSSTFYFEHKMFFQHFMLKFLSAQFSDLMRFCTDHFK